MSKSVYTGRIGLGAAQKVGAPIKVSGEKKDVKPKKAAGRDLRSGK